MHRRMAAALAVVGLALGGPLAFAAPPASSGIRVACVGDSITFGAGVADRAKNCYPAQLGVMLGKGWEVRNFGVSGTTMLKKGDHPYWSQKAFTDAQAFVPNIVVIMLGTNDTKPQNWKFIDEFTTDYRDMVARFSALPTHPRIYLCLPTPVPGGGSLASINEAGVREEKPLIQAVAVQTRSSVIDMYHALTGHDDLLPDHVHPNAAGATIMAHKVRDTLLATKP